MTRKLTFKYAAVGDSGVGKSCLIGMFTKRTFQESHLTTIGVSLAEITRIVQIDDTDIKIQIWDTAGMEVYRSLTTAYYRNSAIILLVYDVTRRSTFENLAGWLSEIRESSNNHHMIVQVVGNKIDLTNERQVSRLEGQQFATQNKTYFMETSAKLLDTVEKLFFLTTRMYYEKIDMGYIDTRKYPSQYGIKLEEEDDAHKYMNFESRNRRKRPNCLC